MDNITQSQIEQINESSIQKETEEAEANEETRQYKNSTYEIISKVAYLIGVNKRVFENETQSPKLEIYEKLDTDKNARIIRHLCIIRNSIERSFKQIMQLMKYELKTIINMPELIPQESINQLFADGIDFYRPTNSQLTQQIIEINRIISDRINNCRSLFPLWLNWNYVKDLFIMPNGLTDAGIKQAASTFYSKLSYYPYKMYINWNPKNYGNILYNDKKFVTLLYYMNNDEFTDLNKVSDVSNYIKCSIYDYIETSEKAVIVVDCENTDPYKLSAVLKNLDTEYTSKISSIILFDDINTASAWGILENFINIPVEHMMIERIKENKSLVDIKLTARACQEHYVNKVDSFIIVSSDSDYWGLIQSLPDARFLVMIENDRCSPDLKKALESANIFYCNIDDFYTGNAENLKYSALFKSMYQYLSNIHLNINDMFNEALRVTRVDMTDSEKTQFIQKYIKTMQLRIESNGDVIIDFKNTIR